VERTRVNRVEDRVNAGAVHGMPLDVINNRGGIQEKTRNVPEGVL
jgi:hypothetical protein